MKKNNVQFITKTALIAAAYAAVTYVFSFMAYGQVQFRISEILVLLAFIDRKYTFGLVLGCVLANAASPLGAIDVVIGSLATFLAIIYIIFVRKIFGYNKKSLLIASLGPVISNALLVGWELYYLFQTPFLLNAFYVAIGEFVVVTIAGTTVMNILMNNEYFVERLKMN